jgi:prepilin signal peptidase PulO-like enzyme (type II secretory pathway)
MVLIGVITITPIYLITNNFDWRYSLFGAILALICTGTTYLTAKLLLKKPGFGLGDVTLSILIGIIVGWKCFILVFFLAHFIHMAFYLIIILIKRKKFKATDTLPFAPAFVTATIINLTMTQGIYPVFERIILSK